MRRLLPLLLIACTPSTPERAGAPMRGSFRWVEDNGWRIGAPSVIHDDARGVTCWQTYNGISCLPDSVLKRVP